MTTETATLFIVRTHRGTVPNDYHSTGDLVDARNVASLLRAGERYAPDRIEIIEQTTTIAERVVE